jgi:aryl-alcohol dehydrogenase-like predicted oxidoreductase
MYQSSLQQWSGGDWALFQELLKGLRKIGDKHDGVSIANVAVAYVREMLNQSCGGGVILGVRDATHLGDSKKVWSLSLDEGDMSQIRFLLDKGTADPGDVYERERGPPRGRRG